MPSEKIRARIEQQIMAYSNTMGIVDRGQVKYNYDLFAAEHANASDNDYLGASKQYFGNILEDQYKRELLGSVNTIKFIALVYFFCSIACGIFFAFFYNKS
jgi:hypothetical protein